MERCRIGNHHQNIPGILSVNLGIYTQKNFIKSIKSDSKIISLNIHKDQTSYREKILKSTSRFQILFFDKLFSDSKQWETKCSESAGDRRATSISTG